MASALNFSRLSKVPPNPCVTNCVPSANVSYTCHAAALHWAYMDQGCNQQRANQLVTALSRAVCPGCKIPGRAHSSISAQRYGQIFCHTGVRITKADLRDLDPGDVLITGHPSMPNHSMVVRQVRMVNNALHVTVRGFNNIGTLGTGQLLQYDPVSHNITKDKYWPADDMFGKNRPGLPLYRVTYANYSAQIARSMRMKF